MAKELNSYNLSRAWFDFCFENPEMIKPNHIAIYFFAIENCNRLGWKKKFALPTTMAKEAIGIKSYNTYISALNDLIEWGFIKMIQKSTNQFSANIIALSENVKASNKALDKALIKHGSKQRESMGQSISSVDKQVTSKQLTNKPINNTPTEYGNAEVSEVVNYLKEKLGGISLDGSVKDNRNLAWHLINKIKKDYPGLDAIDSIKAIIDRGLKDKFHGKNITSIPYIYRNLTKIINSIKNDKSKSPTSSDMRSYIKQRHASNS